MTQEQAAALVEPFLGELWSKAVWSAAERSVDGKRPRRFDADEIAAFSRAFNVPIAWWFERPEQPEDFPEVEDPMLQAQALLSRLTEVLFPRPKP